MELVECGSSEKMGRTSVIVERLRAGRRTIEGPTVSCAKRFHEEGSILTRSVFHFFSVFISRNFGIYFPIIGKKQETPNFWENIEKALKNALVKIAPNPHYTEGPAINITRGTLLIKYLVGPTLHTNTYTWYISLFYQHCLVLLTMAPRNSGRADIATDSGLERPRYTCS